MNDLPSLRGTPKQVKWAEAIRRNTFKFEMKTVYSPHVLEDSAKVTDVTWWITNRSVDDMLVAVPSLAEPHQVVGGPPPPPRAAIKGPAQGTLPIRAGEEAETTGPCPTTDLVASAVKVAPVQSPLEEHEQVEEAERFAESVCQNPALAEVAVLGLLAKQYLRSSHRRTGELILHRARCRMEGLRECQIAVLDKNLDGLRRILK